MRGMFHKARRPMLGALIAVGITVGTAVSASAAGNIPWKDGTFEFSAFDEDIRVVIGKVLKENGLEATFRKGVEGTVSFNFTKIPLQGAFNKLIEENGLQFDYNADTKTVTIFKEESRSNQMVTLNYITTEKLISAKNRLGIQGEVVADDENNIVMFRGTNEQVAALRSLADNLDKAEAGRVKSRLSDDEAGAKAQQARADAAAKEAENAARADVARIRAQMMRDIVDTKVEIIPVRYATVGPSNQTFQGDTVAIPGIDETLRSLLGLSGRNDDKNQAAAGLDNKTKQMVADLKAEMGVVPPDISIDPRSNSIIVRGTPSAIKQVKELVQRLDKPLPLIEIEVMIVNAQKGVTDELGVKWGGAGNSSRSRTVGTATSGIATDNLALPGDTSIDPTTLLPTSYAGSGTVASFVFRGTRATLQAQINALSQESKAQTLSSPRVVTINNLKAQISNDRTKYVQTTAGANSAGTLQKIPAGLKLSIVPSMIQREDTGNVNLIRLNVEASNKDIAFDSSNNAAATGNDVLTQVVIPDGSTFVLGGLTNDSSSDAKDGIPGLKDIPLLGGLFRSDSSIANTTETIFFITPHILKPEEAFAGDIAQRRYMPTAVQAREELQSRSPIAKPSSATIEEDE